MQLIITIDEAKLAVLSTAFGYHAKRKETKENFILNKIVEYVDNRWRAGITEIKTAEARNDVKNIISSSAPIKGVLK